jgi:outer membrane protein OmpA-like peptidoglycan-associated protein
MSDHGSHDDGHGKKKSHGGGHGHGHGGGGHAEGEHEGAPEWLISFADMVMLMMGFFVILFALNVQPKGGNAGGGGEQTEGVANDPNMLDFALAVRDAFNNPVSVNSTDPNDQPLVERLREREAGAGSSNEDGTRGKKRDVTSVRPSDYYGPGTSVPFAIRSTLLDDDSARTVREFAAKHRGMKSVIEIRGHAAPSEAFRKPEEAMQLASDRAMTVYRALVAEGIDAWRLRLAASGDNERVVTDANAESADARNARVEVMVTNEVASSPTPTRPPAPSAGDL